MKLSMKRFGLPVVTALLALAFVAGRTTDVTAQTSSGVKPPDENLLGEFVVTGVVQEHVPKIAILPSLSPDLEDVIVRSVVRRDFELSGLFKVIADQDAPAGLYGFNDKVDVKAWQAKGAEAVVKVAARAKGEGKIEVLGIAYFPSVGADPVYESRIVVDKAAARATAHKITDDLLGALTGRPGGFSSRFTFSGPWGRNRRIFTVDSDGYGLGAKSDAQATALAPVFGPNGGLFFTQSKNYSPFRLFRLNPKETEPTRVEMPYKRSIYGVAFDKDRKRMAVAVSEPEGSAIYVGTPDGKDMKRVSVTEVAIHPAFSPSGKLAWVGGTAEQGGQRIYVEGKAVSPSGFSAFAPTFCDTEDGTFLVYAVSVGNGRQDLVMSNEKGGGIQRLTQNQGTNSYPACSPDGRLLAFFSDRGSEKGLYVLSLKRWTTMKVLATVGETLRWDPLSVTELAGVVPAPAAAPKPATPAPAAPAASTTPAPAAPATTTKPATSAAATPAPVPTTKPTTPAPAPTAKPTTPAPATPAPAAPKK